MEWSEHSERRSKRVLHMGTYVAVPNLLSLNYNYYNQPM